MQATREGKTPAQVRAAIDARYVRGAPVSTPRPPGP
jgi:hypothetical protein